MRSKPWSDFRAVDVGAFRGLLTAWAGTGGLGRGPVKPQDHNGSCGACGAERDGHPAARPLLPFRNRLGIIPAETLLRRSSNSLNQLTKRVHEIGRFYDADQELRQSYDGLWDAAQKILIVLAKLE